MTRREIPEVDAMPAELQLAAIITLLSSLALRGATDGKVEALRAHLEAAALGTQPFAAPLRQALEDALVHWLEVDCPAQANADDERRPAPARLLH